VNHEIVRTRHMPDASPSRDELVQGIFASALAHLEEAHRTIGELRAERDHALARLQELERSSAPTCRAAAPRQEIGRWIPAIATVAAMVVLPLFLAIVLTRAGLPVLALSGSPEIGFKDIIEVLVVGLAATVLVQSWEGRK
jgi:hypothetical protein